MAFIEIGLNLKPKICDELWGTVCMITEEGLIASMKTGQKVLVITETNYDIGSELFIKLIGVQYHLHSFICIGMVV